MNRFGCALLLALMALPAGAGAGGETTLVPALNSSAVLSIGPTEGRVERPGKSVQVWKIPAGVRVTGFAELAAGWVAVGTRPVGPRLELALYLSDGQGVRDLLPPEGGGRLRRDPLLLVRGRHLAGLAWLEGDAPRALAVRAARWTASGWEANRVVAPPGPGTQTALTGSALADGGWLLAWSAFDGEDDEILWSLRRGGAWSAPSRVAPDNAVPDITPSLTATASGALLAWSRYDGREYRVVLAPFATGSWAAPRAAGPVGSFEPAFAPALADGNGDAAHLLLRQAHPPGWLVLALDGSGLAQRQADLPGAPFATPVLAAVDAAGVRLRWTDSQISTTWAAPAP